ncbi:hypothetical protein BBAD15_g1593 [Beauveria bassiana D1-5]|uniref:Uncharacterized protein n=1 Tax=Beauveria bassiana D1-5 TaxID=1245745 RepID=A0A0A2W246_BEABA|nr:hypothetical protein BBAD15_g1593 [Beauveria bassiana D1-5]
MCLREDVLHKRIPPAQGTLGLLADPISDALPAKYVAAGRRRGILELLKTQRAFPLLRALDEAHDFCIREVEPWVSRRGRVRRPRQVHAASLRPASAELRQQQVAIGSAISIVMVEGDVEGAVKRGAFARGRCGGGGDGGERLPDVGVALDGELHDEQHAEHLVARAVGRVGDVPRKDVPQREHPLRKLVVGAAEIKQRERDGLHGRGARQARQVRRDVGPDLGLAAVLSSRLLELLYPRFQERAEAGAQSRQ